MHHKHRYVSALVGLVLCGAIGAHASEPLELEVSRQYLLGLGLVSSAGHLGNDGQGLRLRPLWAFRLGRFRVATSGASELLGAGRETVDPGLSTVLLDTDGWKFSTSLKLDDKRSWDKDPVFSGLPDVRRTLRGRITASGELGARSSWSLGASQDLLGRGGGLLLNAGLGYRYPVSAQTYWDLSVGGGWGSSLYRQTHFGISQAGADATGLAPYEPGSGWNNVSLGWSITSALSRRWVVYGGLSASQLQGAVARSPLVGRVTTYGARVGVAYRNI
jgi:MipA family protein